jgi:meiotic recombination protein REC8
MPWNITTSIQSSRLGSSAAQAFRFGSVGGVSDHQDAMGQLAGLGRSRNRLTSSSPLAGRGFPFDLGNLPIPGDEGNLGDLDLDLYLQSELDPDRHTVSAEGSGAIAKPHAGAIESPQKRLAASGLDQESQNFLEFLNMKTEPGPADAADEDEQSIGQEGIDDAPRLCDSKTAFSALLPPRKTSRVVATHALMHVLTLATKGFLTVGQEPYVDESCEELGTQYRYGEIFLRLPEV